MRIGFIALSGLRLCRTELLELGLTFPGVASRAREIEALPSLGLLTLAGLTPPSVDVEYLEVRDVDGETLPTRFDAVAISTLTATAGEAYRLAKRFRDAGVLVILGGLHAALVPDEARHHADALVIGEGEPVWPQVLHDLQRGTLQPVYDARPNPFDLAASPMPRFDLLSANRYPRFTVQTQRGCPWRCEFCAASIRISPAFKVKPVERVIAEVRRLKDLFGNPFIEFADDNTFVNRAHSRRLMRALAREQVRWFTETDAGVADDLELLQLMRDAGCCQVLIGFEHPHAPALEGVELLSNWKARRADSYLRSIERIQSHGITVNGCFVLGLDGTGPESFDAVARFVEHSGLYEVQITYMTPFPGTPLYRRLTEEGRILAEGAWERCTLFDVNFQPDRMSLTELEEGFVALARRLYGDAAVSQRSRRFRDHLRAGRKQRKPAAA